MGGVESSVGFYNDRKIIRYADGTFEYPSLEAIPFSQKEERAKAFIRIQNSEELKEHYKNLSPALAMDPKVFQKFVRENPEYAEDPEKVREASDYLESISSSSVSGSNKVRSRRPKSNKITPRSGSRRSSRGISTDDDSVSLLTSSGASTTTPSQSDSWASGRRNFIQKISWDCSKGCGILSRFRESRKNRIHDEDLVYQRISSATEDLELNHGDEPDKIQDSETKSLLGRPYLESPL
jgi:hypothetical protein